MQVPVHVLSSAQAARLLEFPDRGDLHGLRDLAVLATMYYAAATAIEIANLDLGDVGVRRQRLVLRGEGGSRRSLELEPELAAILEQYMSGSRRLILAQSGGNAGVTRALFLGNRPQRIRVQDVRQILGSNVKGAGLTAEVNLNTLRLSRAWHLREEGRSPESIQRFLGATSRSGRNVI